MFKYVFDHYFTIRGVSRETLFFYKIKFKIYKGKVTNLLL